MNPTASQLERLLACPGAAALPQANTSSAYAEQGTAAHAEQEAAINDGALPEPLLLILGGAAHTARAEVKLAYDVATGEGRILGTGGDRLYEDLGPFWIYGTADVMAHDEDRVVITDKKLWSANAPAARNMQVGFLALAAARALGKDAATVALLYETGRVDQADLDAIELDQIGARLRGLHVSIADQKARRARGELVDVREGAWCKHCPAEHACPAKVALIRRLVSGGEADELEMMMPLDDRTAAIAYERLGHARNLLRRIEAAIYARAAESPIPLGDGRMLGRHTTTGNESLDGKIARDVMAETIGLAAADRAVTYEVTKARLREVIKETAAPGTAAATERKLLDEIRKRGGASKKSSEKIGEYQPKEIK